MKYTGREGENPSPDSFVLADKDLDNNQYYLPNPVPGKTYTWFVRVTDSYDSQLLDTVDSDMIHS